MSTGIWPSFDEGEEPMTDRSRRFLFVAYCFGDWAGQALIGVYKRSLRIAMELSARGHEVTVFCTGREAYRDELTSLAETRLRFVDFPFSVAAFGAAEEMRRVFLREIARLQPDLVVIGEAPLAGALLESTLCAVELNIPVAFLDNAYNALSSENFCKVHGPMADGIVLAGPSSCHAADSPSYLCQVPPYIDSAPELARTMLTETLGLEGDRLLTVLGYDSKVEKLGISLLERLDATDFEVLFLARDPGQCEDRLSRLPPAKRPRARVIAQPSDPILFGLVELSRLAVVKYGYMQVSECLALRTPVIVVYHEGPQWLKHLPEVCRRFVHVTSSAQADVATEAAFRRLWDLPAVHLADIHTGPLQATAMAAKFLERLSRVPPRNPWPECVELGFREEHVVTSLRALHPGLTVTLRRLRSMRLRELPESALSSLVCAYTVDGEPRCARLWARIYQSSEAMDADLRAGEPRGRRVLYSAPASRLVVEADVGQAMLPAL